MKDKIFPKRFALLKGFSITYLLFALVIRIVLYFISFSDIDFSITHLLKIIGIGFAYDIGSLSYMMAFYSIYLLIIPSKYAGSKVDKWITYTAYWLFMIVITFSFLAEVTFWMEYQRRFNFIAIDYLLYTYEVLENINESYPLPLIIASIGLIVYIAFRIKKKRLIFEKSFCKDNNFLSRIVVAVICCSVVAVFHFNIKNTQAEIFGNVNENELSKSGLYSFFAAYKSNELNYNEFYSTYNEAEVFKTLRSNVKAENDSFLSNEGLLRKTTNVGKELCPNVIFIGMESMSASYLKRFGSEKGMTPYLDKILSESIVFTNLYATGTRTVRGLEAFSLSVPPTPGRSIVKRCNNESFFTVGDIFKQKGYSCTFITGGDGYFDNMANYFSYSGYDIVERAKKSRLRDELPTKRFQIEDEDITFENAWGACDGDIFNAVIKKADIDSKSDRPFFYMLMTNSNHSPYTYPEGKVKIPSGTSRTGAITYADYALGEFIESIKDKKWFENTVFVFASDHCAYSAGRTELNVKSHHIPAFIYNLSGYDPNEIDKLCSQIDILPTLFGYLNWTYTTKLFGKDVNMMNSESERAFIGNHRKLALLKDDKLMVLETQQNNKCFEWDEATNNLMNINCEDNLLQETVSYYQAAYELYKRGQLDK